MRVRIAPRRSPGSCCVYFFGCQQFVKIGWTSFDPRTRIEQLQIANPYEIFEIARIEYPSEAHAILAEREFHERFADSRVRGEWFLLSEPLLAFLSQFRTTYRTKKGIAWGVFKHVDPPECESFESEETLAELREIRLMVDRRYRRVSVGEDDEDDFFFTL